MCLKNEAMQQPPVIIAFKDTPVTKIKYTISSHAHANAHDVSVDNRQVFCVDDIRSTAHKPYMIALLHDRAGVDARIKLLVEHIPQQVSSLRISTCCTWPNRCKAKACCSICTNGR